jgi:hypothetical protein
LGGTPVIGENLIVSSQQPKVFIKYAREDAGAAKRLFNTLTEAGAEPWLDVESLLPGQHWESEIEKAIKQTDFVIALLSLKSLSKRGFVQKELRYALSLLDEIPEGDVFLIPARLDECRPEHKKLQEINWVDLFPAYEIGVDKLLRVIRPSRVVQTGALDSSFVGDELDLAQAGWGVIFPHGIDPAVHEALLPLLELRKEQAGQHDERLYREFSGPTGYLQFESAPDFLVRQGVGPGNPDPKRVPSYLLIIGEPDTVPFSFQYEISVQYRVGRLGFRDAEQYGLYARSVVDVETNGVVVMRRATFFSVTHPHDTATSFALKQLTSPVYESLMRQVPSWQYDQHTGPNATKESLRRILSDPNRASFLFLVAHGLMFPPDDSRHATHQGALLCSDWPGVGSPIEDHHYFGAADVDPSWDLRGLVAWLFTECGAGTPDTDDFAVRGTAKSDLVGDRPSLSELPKALLGRKNGALAVIGHVDRSWVSSFTWPNVGPQTQAFESAMHAILNGHRVATALRYFSSKYAELAAQYIERFGTKTESDDVPQRLWIAMIDARNQILLGDPAAGLKS